MSSSGYGGISSQSGRFGYITPLSIIYLLFNLATFADAILLVAMAINAGALFTNSAGTRWVTWTFWRIFGFFVSILAPVAVQFWLSHVFFRIYYWILNALLVGLLVWHGIQLIFIGFNDISKKTALYLGPDTMSNGDFPFWAFAGGMFFHMIYLAVVLIGAIYIRRRTNDAAMLNAVTSANAISPDATYSSGPNAYAMLNSELGGTVNFPLVVPVGVNLDLHPNGRAIRDRAAEMEEDGTDIETLMHGRVQPITQEIEYAKRSNKHNTVDNIDL